MKSLLVATLFALPASTFSPLLAQEDAKPDHPVELSAKEIEAYTTKDKAVKAIDAFIKGEGKPSKGDGWKQRLEMPPQVEFDPASSYFWHMETNVGELAIRLMPGVAPMHVSSTMYLSRVGFYDDIAFHRVIKRFMAQGGCPLGTGTGGPGYAYDGEYDPDVKHDRAGLLSMANTGRPTSDASQFFLTFVPTPHLNGKHTIFGEVVGAGMQTLKELEKRGSQNGKTTEPLKIVKTWISARPKSAHAAPKGAGARGEKVDVRDKKKKKKKQTD